MVLEFDRTSTKVIQVQDADGNVLWTAPVEEVGNA